MGSTVEIEDIENNLLEQLLTEDSDLDEILTTSSSSSSSSSSSWSCSTEDDEEPKPDRRKLIRRKNFVETTIPNYSDDEFREYFRMNRATAYFIINKIKDAKLMAEHTFGRPKISSEKAFLMTLWFLTNPDSYSQISDRFDVSRSTAHFYINTIVNFLASESKNYILWPQEEINEIEKSFYNLHEIRGIIGAIDVCHINILKPSEYQHAYLNRKGVHSIILQGVCDNQKRFIDIYCGEAGAVHDARVLRKSKLYELAESGQLFHPNHFLLGDSAYPILSWLVPPFRDNGNLSQQQKNFNYRHSSVRSIILHAFGLLKSRFCRLKHFENTDISFVVKAVVAACVLHNVCINLDDLIPYYELEQTDSTEDNIIQEQDFPVDFDRRHNLF